MTQIHNDAPGAEGVQEITKTEAAIQTANDSPASIAVDEKVVVKCPSKKKSGGKVAKKNRGGNIAEKAQVKAEPNVTIEEIQRWIGNAADLAASLEGADAVCALLKKCRVALACWVNSPASKKIK